MGLVWQGRGSKNNPRLRTPDCSATGGGDGGSSQNTPKSRGEGCDKSYPQPNTPKQPNITKYELYGPHSSTLLLGYSTACPQLSIDTNHNEGQEEIPFSFTEMSLCIVYRKRRWQRSTTTPNSLLVCNWSRRQ